MGWSKNNGTNAKHTRNPTPTHQKRRGADIRTFHTQPNESLGGLDRWGSREYRNGGQTDDFAVFCEEMARNIDTEGHNSQDFLQRPIGLHVYHFFWAVLSNLSASHRVSKVTYSTPDPGQPWGRGCRGGTGGGSRGGTLDI